MKNVDVVVVGAGPSGSVASALLNKRGFKVLCVEKQKFPRFVIGESLLPNCMNYLEEAGLLDAVKAHGFQYKNGAAFSWGDEYRYFDFCDKSSAGHGTTFQVVRGEFDKILIDTAAKAGVEVMFETQAVGVDFDTDGVSVRLDNGDVVRAKFFIDASGYSRMLPETLGLEVSSHLSAKKAYFTHITDKISEPLYDRNKILITTHPHHREVWFWLIPFSNGRCSIGIVGEDKFIKKDGLDELETLKEHVYVAPMLARLLKDAVWDTPVRFIEGYSKNVSRLYGDRFILLGNATEFLDPVFSSGVTIAMHSAHLAAKCVEKILLNQPCDLENEYAKPLMTGVNAFRTYVDGWYSTKFQDVIYNGKNHDIKRQICSILAGYAWDLNNPYVKRSDDALAALWEYCK